MVHFILFILFLIVSFYGFSLVTSFEYMSLEELKRRAKDVTSDAARVYPVRTYGLELWFLLRIFTGAFLVLAFLELYFIFGGLLAFILGVLLFCVFCSKKPKKDLHRAAQVSVATERILIILHPVFRSIASFVGKNIVIEKPVIFESRDSLIEMLRLNAENSKEIKPEELTIAINALMFSDRLVGDCMTPLAAVHFVSQDELLSPVTLGELHDSGFSRYPVYKGTNQSVVGTLYLKDALALKKPKPVADVMRHDVFYCNEMQTLGHALKAFLKIKHHMFVVVNEFEDIVGVLSFEDVIREILGEPIMDEFDQHEDLREVAKQLAKIKKQEHHKELV
jgi:CBS domain containing-hemolysin-like protein